MSKILRTVVIAIMAAMLLQVDCYAKAATTAEDDVSSEGIVIARTLGEAESVTLLKGQEYVISYPLSSADWEFSKIRIHLKSGLWITVKEGVETSYLKLERCEAEERVTIKITCKRESIVGLRVGLENKLTHESKVFELKVTVKKADEEQGKDYEYNESWSVIDPPTETNTPDTPEKPSDPDEPNTPEQPDDEEKLIIIDTSGWVFEGTKKVYDGKEYVALVTGIPEDLGVIAHYENNTRTDAGKSVATVTFEVPEGYAVPEAMQTEIIIDKAVIDEITLDRNWMLTDLVNQTMEIKMPTGNTVSAVAPNGVVNVTYEVNGENVGGSYVIPDTGIYSVLANFSLAEGMEKNYELKSTTANAVYNVKPEMFSTPKYEVLLSDITEKPGETVEDGYKKISIWMDYPEDSNFAPASVTWYLRYDPDVLELQIPPEYGPQTSYGSQREYTGDSSSGRGTALPQSGGVIFSEQATLLNVLFKVKDPDAENIVVNVTKVTASDQNGSLQDGTQTVNTNGYGIILNQECNPIEVTLPSKQTTATNTFSQQEEMFNDETQISNTTVEEAAEETIQEAGTESEEELDNEADQDFDVDEEHDEQLSNEPDEEDELSDK